MTPQQVTFADYFAPWGLTLPDEAVARRGDGHIKGDGWSVRFVWRDDATLLFRAGHRMTNERMHAISPDGVLASAQPEAPSEFMVFPQDATPEDKARAEREYGEAWQAHTEAVTAAGLDYDHSPPPADLHTGAGAQLWRLDGAAWQSTPLNPRSRSSE